MGGRGGRGPEWRGSETRPGTLPGCWGLRLACVSLSKRAPPHGRHSLPAWLMHRVANLTSLQKREGGEELGGRRGPRGPPQAWPACGLSSGPDGQGWGPTVEGRDILHGQLLHLLFQVPGPICEPRSLRGSWQSWAGGVSGRGPSAGLAGLYVSLSVASVPWPTRRCFTFPFFHALSCSLPANAQQASPCMTCVRFRRWSL